MPKSHERRRSRDQHQRVSRDESARSETANRSRDRSRQRRRRERSGSKDSSYYRRRDARGHRRSRSRSTLTPPRARCPSVAPHTNNSLQDTLSNIMTRLSAIEHNGANAISTPNNLENSHTRANVQDPVCEVTPRSRSPAGLSDVPQRVRTNNSEGFSTTIRTNDPIAGGSEAMSTVTMLAEALRSLQPARSHSYYVSNFDPNIHDIDLWCDEVDRAVIANGWSDYECLSRVASCLKGDAKVWLNEWVTNDRTWSNFKLEFKPLCPRKLDYANILFETMNTTSDKFATYAEYARRTLLRLRIVKGLTDELRTLIVIRGIDNPQIRAAASNANLATENIVSFLSIYIKPNRTKPDSRGSLTNKHASSNSSSNHGPKCYVCNQRGHLGRNCTKRSRREPVDKPIVKSGTAGSVNDATAATKFELQCSFCKKKGHTEEKCFAKNRSESRNQRNVNLCTDHANNKTDVVTAVVQGIPMDALIDSGAQNVSLISSEVLKHLSCQIKPTHCILKGISEREIIASSFITTTIELSDISIETDLVVVPKSCMNASIIIGTDVLNRDGVTYVRTKDRQYLTRTNDTHVHVNEVQCLDQTLVNTPLQGALRDSLMSVINKFSEFLISGTATSTVTTGEMEIKLTSTSPVVYRPYKLSYSEKLIIREIIKDLLDKGIIRESRSEYASPIILVKKKDGTDRMCIDYRALNRITEKERYPLPLIDDHIDRLGRYTFFTSLDMATGFHQIRIKDASVHVTGFVTPEGHYEYLKMPYGLTNSPIVYQRIINQTLREFIDAGNVLVYIDDVLLLSNTIEDGIVLLQKVLQTLTKSGFSINLKKCSFLTTEVEYLGRIISLGQVRPSLRKIAALKNSPVPKNVRQVRQLLGLAGYFRKYIKNYATKTACIARLTRKGVEFRWGQEQEQVRQDLIQCLTSEPVLTIFNPELHTEVHTDASSVGFGAVLLQTDTDGGKHVVAYFSKVTQGAESKYHSYELETLAVVKALQHFRHYLVGLQFKVVTDCNALKSTERKKDLLPRVARWWIYLQDFHFTIEYRKGVMLPHADYLSRNPVASVNQITRPRNWAQIAQNADHETRDLIQKLSEGQLDSSRYVLKNDLLCYKYTSVGEEARLLCFIPKGHRLSLLRIFHDEHEHIGADKTLHLILKHFWFPGLRQFVSKYVSHCLICISKKRVPRAPLQNISSWPKPNTPFDTVHVDALGPLPESEGYKFILVLVDAFTKFCLLYPIYRQDTSELKRVMSQVVSLFGVPKLLVTDRGRMFEATDFVQWISELGSDLHYITPEMHGSNGQVERYIRTVLNMLRIEVGHKNASWSTTLWKLQLVLNISKQKTTQTSAINLMIGTDASTPVIRSLVRDLAVSTPDTNRESLREICRSRASELLNKNQYQQDASVNRSRRPPREYKVDDLAFVIKYSQSTGKLDPGMRGPYRVTKVLPNGRYELKLLSGSCGKTTQAASQHMVPWKGEWCPESCNIFFENDETDEIVSDPDHSEGNEPVPVSLGLSMPSLDAEIGAVQAHQRHRTAGASQEVQVEDDLASGEAVLGGKDLQL